MKIWLAATLYVTSGFQSFANNNDKTPTNEIALVSFERLEPLSETISIEAVTNCRLVLEPGVKAKLLKDGYSLQTHDGANVEISIGERLISLRSPVALKSINGSWELSTGTVISVPVINARRSAQDDTDSNLKSMQDSAKKLKSKNNTTQDNNNSSGKKLRVRWLYGENPMPTAELFSTPAIQQLTHLSAIGF